MSSFVADSRFWTHRKTLRLRRSPYYAQAVAVWALAGSWCSGDEESKRTGVVPLDAIAGFMVPDWELAVKALVEVGLFDEADDETAVFHDWDFWSGPDARAKRLEKRQEADRVRQQMRRSQGMAAGWSRDQAGVGHVTADDCHVTNRREGFGSSSSSERSKSSSRPKRDINAGRDDARRLCEHLAARIVANGSKPPTITVRWMDAARLLIDADGRTEDQVHKAIDWCQDDGFWHANILSMPTLREKYDQLRLKAQAEAAKKAQEASVQEKPRAGSAVWDRPVHSEGVDDE